MLHLCCKKFLIQCLFHFKNDNLSKVVLVGLEPTTFGL